MNRYLATALLGLATGLGAQAQNLQVHRTGLMGAQVPPQWYTLTFDSIGNKTVSAGPRQATLQSAITGTGPFSLTLPSGITYMWGVIFGGGGGGGGAAASSTGNTSGAGGGAGPAVAAGNVVTSYFVAGKVVSITVGTRGTWGSAGNYGGAGGTTTVNVDGVLFLTAQGGGGGYPGSSASGPGNGGTPQSAGAGSASNGAVYCSGAYGGSGATSGMVGSNGYCQNFSFTPLGPGMVQSTYRSSGGGGGAGKGYTQGNATWGCYPQGSGGAGAMAFGSPGDGWAGGGGGGGSPDSYNTGGMGGNGYVELHIYM